jgi:DNA-binding MarR family transcriptional regulator
VLRRLAKRAMTAKEIAEAATMDAPATTVAVNDLEERGLVVRETDPANRRCKLVSLTDEGRRVVASIDEVDDPAPAAFATLSGAELLTLQAILAKLSAD